ncbi:2OG-Fe(II) oxygenase [candidate division KSB1 bacterium]|nr:2OG-Fe(II) oxygenase [candidate division KSB1 bacterium]
MERKMPGPGRGERAADFVLPLEEGTPTRFYAKAGGRSTVLIFGDAEPVGKLLRFSAALHASLSGDVPIFAVKRTGQVADSQEAAGDKFAMPVFSDVDGKVRKAYRLDAEEKTVIFVLDPNLRVLASLFLEDTEAAVQEVISILDSSLPAEEPVEIVTQAPVLLIPNLLDAGMCQNLIDVWHNQGSEETGVEESHGGRREETLSPDLKRRRDHIVRDKELLKLLTSTIGRRLMPEVQKAFAFRATRFEGFKIVCYDAASGGFFHAHRDNLSPATAHRRFALTLNLNMDYEGGYLRFREYGPHLYRPDTGCGLVFSCSHLHEVTEVTKGRRFALLSFLFREVDMSTSRAKPENR